MPKCYVYSYIASLVSFHILSNLVDFKEIWRERRDNAVRRSVVPSTFRAISNSTKASVSGRREIYFLTEPEIM